MIDRRLVCDRLAKLRERQELLKRLAEDSPEAFVSDPLKVGAAERGLQVSIEICLDVGHHLIAALGLRRPAEYREVFRILGEAGIVPADFAARLEKMAAFRNRLVHLYAEVEPSRVYGFLRDERADLDEFARAIAAFVKKSETS